MVEEKSRWKRGSALIIVLVVCTLISLMIGNSMLNRSLTSNVINSNLDKLKAMSVFRNVLEGYLKGKLGDSDCKRVTLNGDSVYVDQSSWGMFELLQIRVNSDKFKLNKFSLTGQSMPYDFALRVLESGNITYGGKGEIIGSIEARGSVERTRIRELNGGDIGIFETVNKDSHEGFEEDLNYGNSRLEDIIPNDGIQLEFNKIYEQGGNENSFEDPTFIYSMVQDERITNIQIQGNIVLNSSAKVILSASARIQNAIILCESLEIESGFTGNLQVFARTSIVVHDSVTLGYPSILKVQSQEKKETRIEIGQNSTVIGEIHLISRLPLKSGVDIKSNANVWGLVRTNSVFKNHGTVNGSVICKRTSSEFKGKEFENAIFHGTINRAALPEDFGMSNIHTQTKRQKRLITWLN